MNFSVFLFLQKKEGSWTGLSTEERDVIRLGSRQLVSFVCDSSLPLPDLPKHSPSGTCQLFMKISLTPLTERGFYWRLGGVSCGSRIPRIYNALHDVMISFSPSSGN